MKPNRTHNIFKGIPYLHFQIEIIFLILQILEIKLSVCD